MNTDKILDDAREKIAEYLYDKIYHKSGGLDWGSLWESDNLKYLSRKHADQILALSGTTDIKCQECKGEGTFDLRDSSPRTVDFETCYNCGGEGVIKHKWRVRVILENGELPEADGNACGQFLSGYYTAREDMAGYVQEVRQVVE